MTTIATAQIAVTDSPTLILAGNGFRNGASILNIGTETVFWRGDDGVTADDGAALLPGGPAYNIDDDPLYTGFIYGICASGMTAVVSVVELSK